MIRSALALSSLALVLAGCHERPASLDCAQAALPGLPSNPLEIGAREVRAALAAAGLRQGACLFTVADAGAALAFAARGAQVDPRPESFVVINTPTGVAVLGRDPAGAMYGAMEVAERVRSLGARALPLDQPLAGSPALAIRGANLFAVLPEATETSWWFQSTEFWTGYLDLLARSRLNFLDLHGMYNPDNTVFPDALLYFATSKTFPGLGIPGEERQRNLEALRQVVQLAAARGIRVGLMSYRADLSLTGTSPQQQVLTEAELKTYVREAAGDLARSVPGLWRLGFRIGESGHDAAWYHDTFIAGVHDAHTPLELYTRTWLSDKPAVLATASAAGGHFLVEAKLNGEQLALPYPVAGGLFGQRWQRYSYEGYLDPPAPYDFVFQVRAGGTHRIFRQASFERARRLALALADTGAAGFSYELPHAYSGQRDFSHSPADVYSQWTWRRDELQYLLAGRLGYDPQTPEAVFRAALAARVGTDELWPALQAASDIVPWIQAAHTCGADHRDFAPELEWGGPIGAWARPEHAAAIEHGCGAFEGPFDSFAIESPREAADDLLAGHPGARLSPLEIARLVLLDAAAARRASAVAIDSGNAEARDLVRESIALADLGDYFGHKLRAATALAVYGGSGEEDYLAAAQAGSALATKAFNALAAETAYLRPWNENLRMSALGLRPFHWSREVPWLAAEAPSIQAIVDQVAAAPPPSGPALPAAEAWLSAPRGAGPGLRSLEISPPDAAAPAWTVTATLAHPPPPGTVVRILWKRFANVTDWQPAVTVARGETSFVAVIKGGNGGLFAVEVLPPGQHGWRYPDVLEATPYVTLSPAAQGRSAAGRSPTAREYGNE